MFSCHAYDWFFLFLEESLFIWISYLDEAREVRSAARPARDCYRSSCYSNFLKRKIKLIKYLVI